MEDYRNNYRVIDGDLIQLAKDGEFDVIVHGCNCYHIMAAGIAGQIAKHFPNAEIVDGVTEKGSKLKLGDYSIAKVVNDHNEFIFIVNGYTQHIPGRDFRMDALVKLLAKIKVNFAHTRIGFPKIGCGIGGGEWLDVERELKNLALEGNGIKVTTVIYKP